MTYTKLPSPAYLRTEIVKDNFGVIEFHNIFDADLNGDAELHRFNDANGERCSAIYQYGREVYSSLREDEDMILKMWNMVG